MISLKKTGFIFFVILIRLCVAAQPVVDFSVLEHALKSNSRNEVIVEFNRLCEQASSAEFRNETFEKLLNHARDLSRRGYSETVYKNLEKLSGENEVLTKFSKRFFSSFFNELGYAYYHNKKLQKADSVFRLNLKLKELFPEIPDLEIAFSLNYLGLTQRRLGNYPQAIIFLEKAKKIRIAELGGEHQQVGAIFNNIGLVYNYSGDYDSALVNFKEAIRIKQLSGNSAIYNNYFNLGVLSGILGNYTEALNNYKQAEALLLDSDNPETLADVYMNTGGILNTLKANREAFLYFQKALQIYIEYLGDQHKKTADVYQNLSSVYDELGEYEKSYHSFKKALEINENLYGQSSTELAPLFNNFGLVLQKRGKYQESLNYLRRAKSIYSLNDNQESESYFNTLINIGEVFQLLNLSDSAKYFFQYAIENLEPRFGGKHPLLAHANNRIAETFLVEGNIAKATDYIQNAILANTVEASTVFHGRKEGLNPSYLFESYLIQGKIELYTKNRNNTYRALSCFHLADSMLSVQRNFLFNKDDKITLAENSKRLTGAVLDIISDKDNISTEDLNIAFRYLEKSKNLVLLQSINENKGKSFAGIPSSVLIEEEEIKGRINYLTHQINLETDSLETVSLENRLFDEKLKYKSLVEKLEKNYPDYFKLKYQEYVPEITVIQDLIDRNTVVASYFLSGNAVFRLLIFKNSVRLDKIETTHLDDQLVGMRKGITLKLNHVFLEKAYELGNLLVPRDIPETISHFIVVPDGALSILPFEALLLAKPLNENNMADLEYFGKKFHIRYTPSTAIWENMKMNGDSKPENYSFLGYAPVFERLPVEKRVHNPEHSLFSGMLYNSMVNSLGVAPLSDTKSEVLGVDSLFTERQYNSEVFMLSDASERNMVTMGLGDYGFIHIATHGFIDKNNPELSGLILAPVNNKGFDNVLYTDEIYNLKFDAELVTLSACETGLGKVAEGEGLLGFARAFFYSGAKNLLLSLWKVNDRSTSVLMNSFYSNLLGKKMSYTEALHSAKKQLMDDENYSHPYYWAPFILIGN